MTVEDRLDMALDGDAFAYAASAEVQALVDTGDEVIGAMAAWSLDPGTRARIYATAVSRAGTFRLGDSLRTLGLDRRVQAIAGGAVVTLAAVLGFAIARGRRHAPTSAVLGA
jgi:hypothetical protein